MSLNKKYDQLNQIIIFDFLSDPMGGLLTSAREFLKRVRGYDNHSRIIVLELNRSISLHLGQSRDIDWINVDCPEGMVGWRRVLWQNIHLPRIIGKYNVNVYVSLSHYLPWTLPKKIKKIIGVSNLAPFSKAAFDSEIHWKKKLRLKLLSKSIISSANHADVVIALSNACKCELVMRGVSEHKVVIIPNGVTRFDGFEIALPFKSEHYILSVSHFYRYKNYERLVKAYSLLPEYLTAMYPLFLVGKPYDIEYYEQVKLLIQQLGLTKSVMLIPGLFGSELVSAYRNCTLFVFPSLIENCPITLLEAMAYGAPTIVADVAAMREFGQDSVVYFNALSELDLYTQIESLLLNLEQRLYLSESGKSQVSQYTWEEFTKRLVKTYMS